MQKSKKLVKYTRSQEIYQYFCKCVHMYNESEYPKRHIFRYMYTYKQIDFRHYDAHQKCRYAYYRLCLGSSCICMLTHHKFQHTQIITANAFVVTASYNWYKSFTCICITNYALSRLRQLLFTLRDICTHLFAYWYHQSRAHAPFVLFPDEFYSQL